MQALCLLPLVVNYHVDHIPQTLILQLLAQAVHSAQMREIGEHKNQLPCNKVVNYTFLDSLLNKQV